MWEIIFSIIWGLGLFLLGMRWMRRGLEVLTEKRLQSWLLTFTKTPFRGFLTGTCITALLQSSTAVTVLTIGFVNAGILSFTHSLGIILGTNIGTTITTQLLTLHIEDLAIPMILVGLTLCCFSHPIESIGKVILGFGFMFFAINSMQGVAVPLKKTGYIDWFLAHSGSPIWAGLFLGIVVTALIHSSSAMIAMTMSFYDSQVIDLPFALAIILGSNIGTCVTGLIASLQTNLAAKRVAMSHVILNLGGAMIFAPFIPYISPLIPLLSNDLSLQIAHTQTLYNVICSLLVLPFTKGFAQLIEWILPDEKTWHFTTR